MPPRRRPPASRAGRSLAHRAARHGRLIGPGLRSGTDRRAFIDHLREISALYETSGIQNVAVNAYQNAIFSTGLRFAATKAPVSGMLASAVNEMIRCLCLYGFCSYRLLLRGDEQIGADDLAVQIPDGVEVPVRFSTTKLRWVPDLSSVASSDSIIPDAATEYLPGVGGDSDDEEEETGWRCIVSNPPTELRCTSYAAQSQSDAVRIEEIYRNVQIRDSFNSMPHVYTTVDEAEFSARGRAGGQPFLRSSLDVDAHTGQEGVTSGMDYQQLIAARSAMLRGLADATDRTTTGPGGSTFARTGVGLPGDSVLPEREITHQEHSVTQGRKATPIAPLHSPENIDRLIIRLRLNVLEAFGVAPQFVGESVSAERVGSNAASTSTAMRMFQLRANALRDLLPVAELGLEWENRVAINSFERLFPLLSTDAAVEMAASVFQIDAAKLDPDRVRRQQDAMLGDTGGETAPTNAPEQLKGKRKRKTELEKEVTDLNKGSSFN